MVKILVSDSLSKEGLEILENSGYQVDVKTGMSEDELCSVIGDYDCLIIRSGTKVTAKVIEAADNLRIIGRAGVGVDNIDVPAATAKGILVMNTPSANILSAAEHSCAMLLALARNIPFAHESMHKGEWKRSKFTGVEMNGKILGIIGVGRVGGEVAKRMKAFNMTLIGYDPFLPKEVADAIGVRLTTLEEVITTADFMTIHTPLLPETRNMISLEQFKMMKPNARIANVARGGIVNEDDLYTALKEKIIAGAAFDVWCNEPLTEDEAKLLELDNLVTTPHLGASTVEAQERVAVEIAEHAIMYLKDDIISNAINAPRGKLDAETEPFVVLAERMGSLVQQTVGNHPLNKLEVSYCGSLAGKPTKLLTVSAVIGYLKNVIGTANTINALPVAKSKGVEVVENSNPESKDYASVIQMKFTSQGVEHSIRGTVIGGQNRLVGFDEFSFDIPFYGHMMFVGYDDAPGVIGIVGNNLGKAGINVGQMSVGRSGKKALMFLTVDHEVPANIMSTIAAEVPTDYIRAVRFVE
ncbi:MAG: phosphoglycerate dehydrogenase [Candidatus Methanomethylophilaceae archaeon]|jgi:D-3-phosphoglycerate dehydrogenase|nr:phosphoglycerate dehydrogenase [Thermoplasmata archaeon]MBR3409599.1 phosphoglycerate dehydrogenase [Candidatus Methanomethylophilaceae archaeon]MBR6871022.1 phosphoglycerate dehydrogenase [Candidatus Methanomethylophilaceae archaeon]